MVNVSKHPVSPRIKRRIEHNLAAILFSRGMRGSKALEALLSPAEQVMLTKRLAVIIMLERGHSYYRISKTLKVSIATARSVDIRRRRGAYRAIQSILKQHKGRSLLTHIELLLAAGMPSIAGPRTSRRLEKLRKTHRSYIS